MRERERVRERKKKSERERERKKEGIDGNMDEEIESQWHLH